MISNTILYICKYYTILWTGAPPPKPASAAGTKKLFYFVLFFANLVGIIPIGHFLSARNNPNCGPLRTLECALEQTSSSGLPSINSTACNSMIFSRRANYAAFTETLMPNSLDGSNPLEVFSEAVLNNNATLLNSLTQNCGLTCYIGLAISGI